MKKSKDDRRWLHIVKYIKCWLHQPFIPMRKSESIFGYICPKCGNILDEMWREYQLKKLSRKF